MCEYTGMSQVEYVNCCESIEYFKEYLEVNPNHPNCGEIAKMWIKKLNLPVEKWYYES